jgi:cytochrome b561
MSTAAAVERYHPVSIAFHWLLALAIVGALGVGLYMTSLPMSPTRLKLYNWHKWAGVAILVLSAARLLRAAHLAHGALYGLFFAVPLAGWAYSSAAGFPIVWFGVLPLPDFVPVDRELSELIKPVHRWLAYTLAAVVVLHVAAALKHHFIDHDGLLQRMRPGRG